MNTEIELKPEDFNVLLAKKLLDGRVACDNGRILKEGDFFTVSSDKYQNYLILTGFDEYWPDKFITLMGYKLKTYVTTILRWEGGRGEDSLTDISGGKMKEVCERMKEYE